MTIVAICGPGPATVLLAEERGPERWCFGERRRAAGTHRLMGHTAEDVLSGRVASGWAEPRWVYACDGCGRDRRLGFGMVWEWDE